MHPTLQLIVGAGAAARCGEADGGGDVRRRRMRSIRSGPCGKPADAAAGGGGAGPLTQSAVRESC